MLARSGREPHEKRDTLRRLIRSAEGLKNAIIFCNRKRDVATLFRSLLRHGFSVQALHGDMDQSARTAALEQFRKGEVTLLVASDVAARGLDIPAVSHIYNFDVPLHADDYVHRIGRTGRAGRSGTAITHGGGCQRRQGGRGDRKADRPADPIDGQSSRPQAPTPERPPRCTASLDRHGDDPPASASSGSGCAHRRGKTASRAPPAPRPRARRCRRTLTCPRFCCVRLP